MKVEDAEYLSIKIRDEGFHYCFKHYSRFEDIDDEEFHKLRKYYLQYADLLEHYIKKEAEKEDYGDE